MEGQRGSQSQSDRRQTCNRSAAPWLCSRSMIDSGSIVDASILDCSADNFPADGCSAIRSSSMNCSSGNNSSLAMIEAVKLPLSCCVFSCDL